MSRVSIVTRTSPSLPLFIVAVGIVAGSVAVGCGGGLAEQLETASVKDQVPEGLVVVYDDFHPTWGGMRIEVRHDHTLEARRWRPGQPEDAPDRWEGEVPAQALRSLVELLVDIEVWEQQVEAEQARLDDARATLVVRVGEERERLWEWSNDLEANRRLVRVKRHLEALAFEARHPMAP